MPRRHLVVALAVAASSLFAACGEQGIQLAEDDPYYEGARIFNENCAGCHSLEVVGADGSAVEVGSREQRDGPNFNERHVERDQVLYAIENGGFSSQWMPQDIVVGEDAEKVADFLAEFSGRGE